MHLSRRGRSFSFAVNAVVAVATTSLIWVIAACGADPGDTGDSSQIEIHRIAYDADDQDPGLYRRVSPIEHLDPNVPVIAVHGSDDRVVFPVNSERYVAALNAAGGSAKLVMVDGETHESVVNPDRPFYPRLLDYVVEMATAPQAQLLAKYRNGGRG